MVIPIIVGLAILAVLLIIGMPIAFSLMAVGVYLLFFGLPFPQLMVIGRVAWDTLDSFPLAAVPLFILMGELLLISGISELTYTALSRWLDRVPGGLAHVNIAACAIFAAVSGSSVATAATVGAIALPSMDRRGYDRALTRGSVASGGTLGILIPPSIPMIVYGVMVGESIGRLFIAGVIPGLLLATAFSAYIFIRTMTKPALAPRSREPFNLKQATVGLVGIMPTIVLIVLVLGTIYLGVATATEAAAMGVAGAFILCLVGRRLNWQTLLSSLRAATQTTSMVFMIMVGAYLINYFLGYMQIPKAIASALVGQGYTPTFVIFLLFLVYLVMGCFLDGMSMMILTIPALYPGLVALGIDLVWFGIFVIINIEIALLTPPVGMNLFVLHGLDPSVSIGTTIRGALPFILVIFLFLVILVAFPSIALWLPSQMMR